MDPGDVVHLWLDSQHLGGMPSKFKYAISLDPKEKRFLLINSAPRTLTPAQNVTLDKNDATYLPNLVSYIDTSRLIGLTFGEFQAAMAVPGASELGRLPQTVLNRVMANVSPSRLLPAWQKALIAANLGPLPTPTASAIIAPSSSPSTNP
jgi:hypothetical protein